MRFLCASNLHLGRRIPGVPHHLNLDPNRISTSAIWEHLVETAVKEQVDAVLLAGNVIDRENRQFEPLGPLERGITTLERHGIPVIGVAGNHDFDTLGDVARSIGEDAFDVLAADTWDRLAIQDVGTIVGRSTSSTAETADLVQGLPDAPADVMLLHASLTDGSAEDLTFQPIPAESIKESQIKLWVLGHSREPDLITLGDSIVVEPGAICPLDPTETGPHGVWIVDTEDATNSKLLAISPVQFEDVDIDVSGTDSLEGIENAVVRALHETLATAVGEDEPGRLLCVPCAVHLTGTTDRHHELPELMNDLASTLDIQHRGVVAAITAVEIDTMPDLNLASLLGRPDPVGELARLLISLDSDGEGAERSTVHDALIQRTVNRLQTVHRARAFATVANDPEPNIDAARTLLRRESWNVLDALVRQRGVE